MQASLRLAAAGCALSCLTFIDAGVPGYTETYSKYANGGASHYIASFDGQTEQECAELCTTDVDCRSFEWRDPAGTNGAVANCKTSFFSEADGPGLVSSGVAEYNFYAPDAVECPTYAEIDGAVVSVAGTAKGDKTVVACDDGYYGGGTSVCQGTGQYDQQYGCFGTSSGLVVAGTDCTWRERRSDAAGTFETGTPGAVPTYWLEQPWNHGFCWTGSVTIIGTNTISIDACKALCDADLTCTGATYDGADCVHYSGDGSLTRCAAGNYGYQQESEEVEAVAVGTFAHCGDRSVAYVANVSIGYEWVFLGCFDEASYFKDGDFSSVTADEPATLFADAETNGLSYVAMAFVDGDDTDGDSVAFEFSELWKTASISTACQVNCTADDSLYCGDQTEMDEAGRGGWAVYVNQPIPAAMSVVTDNGTDSATFNLYAGQSYLAHFWALVRRNSTMYPAGTVKLYSRVSDDQDTFSSSDTNTVQTAFEWVPFWHDLFAPVADVDFAQFTVGVHTVSNEMEVFVDDVIVYCVSCCYPNPDFFLPDRMYFDDDTGELGKLASESGFWNSEVSSDYTTAMVDSYVTQVCGAATSADESATARVGLSISYRADDHPIIGGDYVLEMGPEGVARAYNFDAEPDCGCWVVNSGTNSLGGYYKTNFSLNNAPIGKWTYGAWIRVSSDWDGSSSAFQVRWFDAAGDTIITTSTGAWINVDAVPVYGEFLYATKTVTLSKVPAFAQIFTGGPGFNDVGALETFSMEIFDPTGHDWLEGNHKSECGAHWPNFEEIVGGATITNVTCEEFMSPFWTEHKLEGVATTLDATHYAAGDTGCVTYVFNNTWTQTSEYTGNSWDFYNSCDKFCTDAGSVCLAAQYQETAEAVDCRLGPVPDKLECKCDNPLIVYSVTTNDDYDVSLNVGTTDTNIVTGGTNADSSFAVSSDEECMVLCRDIANCAMFEFYGDGNCMLYQSNFDVVTETCLGRFEWSDRTDGACDAVDLAFDSGAGSNNALFDGIQEIITDDGYTAASRQDMDELCEALCEDRDFDCLAYAVADDVLFASNAYKCVLYSACDSIDTGEAVEHFTKDFSHSYMVIGKGLRCADASSTVVSGVTSDECSFLCLVNEHCLTFSWVDGGDCKYSNTAAQCTLERHNAATLHLLTECAFFEKGSETETDVFHAVKPAHHTLFGAVAPFNDGSTLTNVALRTAWETCDPGGLFSLAAELENVADYCDGDWSSDLAGVAVTEVALCYDAAVADAGSPAAVQMVLFGDDGACYYTTSAASVAPDASCGWTMDSAAILTAGLGIEFAPPTSTVTTLWDGTCFQEGGDATLHPTCTGPAACLSGWEGITCDTDIDDCLSFPCEDHLQCFDLGTNLFECRCVGGWGGMCTQPLSLSHRQALFHAKYCWVASDRTCSTFADTQAFTGAYVSMDVCKNYCSASDWCTHLAWDTANGECRLYDSTDDGCTTRAVAANNVIFTPCADAATQRQTEGFRYLEIGSRGTKIMDSFEREDFVTIQLV